MPAVPQGAFITHKVRKSEMLISKMHVAEQESENLFYDQKYMELSPLKYNSKLMNSIWGLYNRYSVHNFKKNTDAEVIFSTGCQQIVGTPAPADKGSAAAMKGSKSSPSVFSDFLARWGRQNSY